MCKRSVRSPSKITPGCTPLINFTSATASVQLEGDLNARNPFPNLRFKL